MVAFDDEDRNVIAESGEKTVSMTLPAGDM
jgi:hypothetical protein